MTDRTTKRETQSSADLRDNRGGAYDPVNELGMPQPDPPYDTPSMAPVQHPQKGDLPPLPEGLRRSRMGPDHKPRQGQIWTRFRFDGLFIAKTADAYAAPRNARSP